MEKTAYTFFQRQCAEYCSKIAAGGSFTAPRHLDDEPENFIERYLGSDIYIYRSVITDNGKAYRARHTDEPSDYTSGYATLEEMRQNCRETMQTRKELVQMITENKVISQQGVEWIAKELLQRSKIRKKAKMQCGTQRKHTQPTRNFRSQRVIRHVSRSRNGTRHRAILKKSKYPSSLLLT